jgi:hypothetical protein
MVKVHYESIKNLSEKRAIYDINHDTIISVLLLIARM